LVAWWGEGHAEPWLLLTDLEPPAVAADCYGYRAWIEQGFKDHKRGGLQGQDTGQKDAARRGGAGVGRGGAGRWAGGGGWGAVRRKRRTAAGRCRSCGCGRGSRSGRGRGGGGW